jgi:hypothetical protein
MNVLDWFAARWKRAAAVQKVFVLGESPALLCDIDVTGVDAQRDSATGLALLPIAGADFRLGDIRYVPFSTAEAQVAADVQAALARVGDLPLICYNPTFVRYMLERGLKRMQVPAPDWQWLDLGNMLEGAFGKEMGQVASLETWHQRLGVAMVRRHDAVSDVYAMAQMFAMLTSQCEEQGWRTLDELMHAREGRLWLRGD